MITDQIAAFSFDAAPIHGRVVTLTNSWLRIRDRHRHAPAAERLLGEMVGVVAMLAQGIKLDGSVILQIRGEGPVTTVMAECTDRTTLRGMLRENGAIVSDELSTLVGNGRLAITLKPHRGEMYQGIVSLDGSSVADAVESYFAMSEQLPTRIWVAAEQGTVAGLLLQRMPDRPQRRRVSAEPDEDAWQRVQLLADTVSDQELLSLPAAQLLGRLFHTEAVRLQPPSLLSFGCSCSRQRTANALRIMGRTEVDSILAQEGCITVTCEFCGTTYGYDAIDARLLFEPLAANYGATTQ
jgi:molecular chaperone Hsp33